MWRLLFTEFLHICGGGLEWNTHGYGEMPEPENQPGYPGATTNIKWFPFINVIVQESFLPSNVWNGCEAILKYVLYYYGLYPISFEARVIKLYYIFKLFFKKIK